MIFLNYSITLEEGIGGLFVILGLFATVYARHLELKNISTFLFDYSSSTIAGGGDDDDVVSVSKNSLLSIFSSRNTRVKRDTLTDTIVPFSSSYYSLELLEDDSKEGDSARVLLEHGVVGDKFEQQ
jgi:hypothetical protein